MKKRVSMFLALLMLFSALLAFPAEAVQPNKPQSEQTQGDALTPSLRQKGQSPGAVYKSNACAHSYSVTSKNRLSHKLTCSKCGDSYVENHIFKYKSTSSTEHKKYCTVCGFSYTYAHDLSCTSVNQSKHKISCSQCDYSKTENHSITKKSLDASWHQLSCSKCNYSNVELHTIKYRDNGYHTHEKYCKNCKYSVLEDHDYNTHMEPRLGGLVWVVVFSKWCLKCYRLHD